MIRKTLTLVKSVLLNMIFIKSITHLAEQTPPDGTDLPLSWRAIHHKMVF